MSFPEMPFGTYTCYVCGNVGHVDNGATKITQDNNTFYIHPNCEGRLK